MSSTPRAEMPPMLRLYLEYKDRLPDALLFFQVGDFYELFFDDAKIVAAALNLTLTSRDRNSPNPVPMCGVPISVIDSYIERLLSKGFSAAIVSQRGEVEGRRGMVERQLERIVTPGVRVLAGADSSGSDNVVASLAASRDGEFSIAYTAIESGVLRLLPSVEEDEIVSKICETAPAELILPTTIRGENLDRRSRLVREIERRGRGMAIKFRTPADRTGRENALSALPGFSSLSAASKDALVLLGAFLEEVTAGREIKFRQIELQNPEDLLLIDPASRDHLELVNNMRDGSLYGTLLACVSEYVSASSGRRKLRNWILSPLRSINKISERQDGVQFFIDQRLLSAKLQEILRGVSDIERIASRIELEAVTPRELGELRSSLEKTSALAAALSQKSVEVFLSSPPPIISELVDQLPVPTACIEHLSTKLVELPPLSITQAGIFRAGVSAEIDRLRALKQDGRSQIAAFEAAEKERTKIGSLKVKFNNVFGYYIEITKANLDRAPSDYIPKSLTANGQRFITPELKKWEEDLSGAEGKLIALERELFEKLKRDLLPFVGSLRSIAAAVGEIDALLSLAEYAVREECVRPALQVEKVLLIEQGRHPVLSKLMGRDFVPNSLELGSATEISVITGPNMGGKSTFLKQAALLVVLAQIGSFVPAKRAVIGVVDRLFTRIGASDSLLEGESTFMVEMREMAYILEQATEFSLLLIDEIGRGTATVDGMALAQSILEHLLNSLRARTLFATHFHHLTALDVHHHNLQNLSVGSVDRDGEVFFTHEIKNGAASRSYGLHVAKLAGISRELIDRAEELVETAASERPQKKQLSMFNAGQLERQIEKGQSEDYQKLLSLSRSIKELDPQNLTPIQALCMLNELRERATKDE